MRTMSITSDSAADRPGRRSTASQKKFRKPQARTKVVLATTSTSDHSMMAKAAIWIDATTTANRPSTVAVKPTRFFRKVIAIGIDDCRGISPDDSRTSANNSSAFPASLEDRRECGRLPAPRAARMVVEGLIWPFPQHLDALLTSVLLLNGLRSNALRWWPLRPQFLEQPRDLLEHFLYVLNRLL